MKQIKNLTAIIEREGGGYVALCPELDIASQGESIEEARTNLKEALELFLETADQSEIHSRMHGESPVPGHPDDKLLTTAYEIRGFILIRQTRDEDSFLLSPNRVLSTYNLSRPAHIR